MRKRLGHSPDLADALCVTFGPGVTALPAVNLALVAGLTQRPVSHRRAPIPGARRSAVPPDPSRSEVEDMVRQRWSVADPYDDEPY